MRKNDMFSVERNTRVRTIIYRLGSKTASLCCWPGLAQADLSRRGCEAAGLEVSSVTIRYARSIYETEPRICSCDVVSEVVVVSKKRK